MRHLSNILFLIIIGLQAYAQSSSSDHLKAPWTEEKIDFLLEWAEDISVDAPDTALSVAALALKKSHELNYKKGIKNASLVKGLGYSVLGKFDSAHIYMDSLLKVSAELGDSTFLGKLYYYLAQLYYDQGKSKEGLQFLEKSLEVRKVLKDSIGTTAVYNITGNIFVDLGLYYQALEAYQNALEIDLALGNKTGLSSRYNNIARIYTLQNENDRALEYYQKAFDLALETKDLNDQAIYANNMAYIHKVTGNYNKALQMLNNALDIHSKQNLPCRKIYPMYNKGSIYVIQGLLDSASYYLNWVLPQTLKCQNDQYLRNLTLIDLGKMHMKKGNYANAEKLLLEAYNSTDKYRLPAEKMEASLTLAGIYDSINQPRASIRYLKNYHSINDSLYSAKKTREQAQLEAEFEFKKQKKEEELARKLEEAENEKQLANAIWVRNSFVIGFTVMGIIAFLIYRNYARKMRANRELNQLNVQITQQKEELEAQAEELTSANEEITRINENLEQIVRDRTKVITQQNQKILEYVFYNSHQVRGPLARILGLVSLFENKGITESEMQEKLHELRHEAVELDEMVKKMNRILEKGKQSLKKQQNDSISNA